MKSYQLVYTSTDSEPKPLTPQHQESRHSQYYNDIASHISTVPIRVHTQISLSEELRLLLSLGAGVTLFKICLLNMYNLKQRDFS